VQIKCIACMCCVFQWSIMCVDYINKIKLLARASTLFPLEHMLKTMNRYCHSSQVDHFL